MILELNSRLNRHTQSAEKTMTTVGVKPNVKQYHIDLIFIKSREAS